jgi:hypothetical protein
MPGDHPNIRDVLPPDFIHEVQRGNIPGQVILRGLGERDSIGTTANGEDLWRGNELSATPAALGSHTTIPAPADAGEQMTLVSENAADAAAGTGARTIDISYLDAAGDEQSETVTMNGITQVDTVATDIRFVQDMQVKTVGSNGASVGNIRIFRESDESRVYNMIREGGNQSLVPHKMVPRAKTLHLRRWLCSEASNAKRCHMRLRADCDNEHPPVRQAGVFLFKSTVALDSAAVPMDLAYSIPALSIVKVSGQADVSGAELAVHWWGVLVDD